MKFRFKSFIFLAILLVLFLSLFTACSSKTESFTVTFMVDNQVYQTKSIKADESFIPPAVPDKEGFKGAWDIAIFTKITEDTIVNAVYSPLVHRIIFKAENDNQEIKIVETKNVSYGGNLSIIPQIPQREGYSAVWNVTNFENIKNDFEVLAIYTKNIYLIEFDTNGGTYIDSLELEYQAPIDVSTYRNGYELLGWYKDNNFTVPFSQTNMPAENLKLYADWRQVEYTITLNTKIPDQNMEIYGWFGKKIEELPTTTLEYPHPEYKFNGWYLDRECTLSVILPYTITQNAIFYASWIVDNQSAATDPKYFVFNQSTQELSMNTDYVPPAELVFPNIYNGIIVKGIADFAFANTNITSITIPESIERIGDYAFASSSLEEVSIDYNSRLFVIGNGAFMDTSIVEFEFPFSLRKIGHAAFYHCTQLEYVANIFSLYNLLSIGGLAFEDTVWYNYQVSNLSGTIFYIGDVVYSVIGQLSSNINLFANAISISSEAFFNQINITQLNLPDSVQYIGGEYSYYFNGFEIFVKGAFDSCQHLEELNVRQSSLLKEIGAGAFTNCKSLTSVPLTTNLAFAQLFSISYVPNSYIVEYNSYQYYIPNQLKTVNVFGNTQILPYGFANANSIENINFYSDIKLIGEYAFYNCINLEEITIPVGVEFIGNYAFANSSGLRNIYIPSENSIVEIGAHAFSSLVDTYFNIQDLNNLLWVGEQAFSDCTKLAEFTAQNIKFIGQHAFSGCRTLNVLTVPTSLASVHTLFEYSNGNTNKNSFYLAMGYFIPYSLEVINLAFANHATIAENFLKDFESVKTINTCEGIQYIQQFAFSQTKVVVFNLPDSVIGISENSFYRNLDLTSIIISDESRLQNIPYNAFGQCELLETIFIPKLVEVIELSAFKNCLALSEINVDEQNSVYYSFDGVLYKQENLILAPHNKQGACVVKDGTKYIAENAFSNSCLAELSLPQSLIKSQHNAFNDCQFESVSLYADSYFLADLLPNVQNIELVILKGNAIIDDFATGAALKKVELAETMTVIGQAAFEDCQQLISLKIGQSVESIYDYAFNNCIELVDIEFVGLENIEFIGQLVFETTLWYSNLEDNALVYIGSIVYSYKGELGENTTIDIKEGTTVIATSAFKNNQEVTVVNFPSTLKIVGDSAFMGASNLTEVLFNQNLYVIGEYAFYDCVNLLSIDLSSTDILTINRFAFYNTGAEEIMLNIGLEAIKENAFENNQNITQITIPYTLRQFGDKAFYNCNELSTIIIENIVDIKTWGQGVFENTRWYNNQSDFVYIDQLWLYAYKGQENHLNIDIAQTILPYAFADNQWLVSIYIDSQIQQVDRFAFIGCVSLENVEFAPNSQLMLIEEYAFSNCIELSSVTLPHSLESINSLIFDGCIVLEDILFEQIQQVEPNFNYVDNILYNQDFSQILFVSKAISGEVVIKDSVTEIPEYAFENCYDITTIYIHDALQSIGNNAFKNCTLLSQIIFDNNSHLNYIGEQAFYQCDLDNITLPARVNYIGKDAFYKSNITNDRIIHLQSLIPPTIVGLELDDFVFFVPRNALEIYQNTLNASVIYADKVVVKFIMGNVTTLSEVPYGGALSSLPEIIEIVGFTGKWVEEELLQVFQDNQYKNIYQDLEINAAYTRKEFSINYYDDLYITSQQFLFDRPIQTLSFQPAGRQFLFWTEDLDNPIPFNLARMPAKDIDLYAMVYKFDYIDNGNEQYIVIAAQDNIITPNNIIIPDSYNDKPVIGIGQNAFNNNGLIDKVTLSPTIVTIYNYAFASSSIKELIIPEQSQLSSIFEYAFYNSNLQKINFSNSQLESIGKYAFSRSQLSSLNLVIDISHIGEFAFAECGALKTVDIQSPPSIITYIDHAFNGVFSHCYNLEEVILPPELILIENEFFDSCYALQTINLENIKQIKTNAFANCYSLEYIFLPNIISIESYAFVECNALKAVYFEENSTIYSIGEYAFSFCTSLTFFVVPASTKYLYQGVFVGCNNLEYIIILENGNNYDGSRGLSVASDVAPSQVIIYVKEDLASSEVKWAPNSVMLYRKIVDEFVIVVRDILLYIGSNAEIAIPDMVDDDYIEGILPKAFVGAEHISSITLSDVQLSTYLTQSVFYELVNLEEFIAQSQKDGVLYNLDYSKLIAYPINKSNATYLIAESITEIGDYAFYGAKNLQSLTINNLVPPIISVNTFENTNQNFKIYVHPDSISSYKTADIWSSYADIIYPTYIPHSDFLLVAHDEGYEISQYIGSSSTVTIPLSVGGRAVVAIGDYAFYNSDISSIHIPTNIKYIGNYAFAHSGLESIYLSSSVKNIGQYAFAYCSYLTSFTFNNTIQLPKLQAFTFIANTALENITIPNSITELEEGVFSDCTSLSTVEISSSSLLQIIGEYAFSNCVALSNITMQKSRTITIIGDYAFNNCTSLNRIDIPESLIQIKSYAFNNCSGITALNFIGSSNLYQIGSNAFLGSNNINKLTVPASVNIIGEKAFYNNSFSQIIFSPNSSLSEIGKFAFAWSTMIEQVHLYGYISSIKEGAFANCDSLRWIKIQSELPPTLESDVWDARLRIYVPENAVSTYKQNWTQYSTGINSLSRIDGDYSYILENNQIEIFQYMGNNSHINLPSTLSDSQVISIGSYAFGPELESIIIPNTVTTLKRAAFNNSKLENVHLPFSIVDIQDNPFINCYLLRQISIDSTNTYFRTHDRVLYNSDLTKLIAYPNALEIFNYSYDLPSTVVEIGVDAFRGANKLLALNIPSSVRTIGANAFMNCTVLLDILFDNATVLEYIGENAFTGSQWLNNQPEGVIYIQSSDAEISQLTVYGYKGQSNNVNLITVDSGTKTILPYAFKNFVALENIELPSSAINIGQGILEGCNNLTKLTMPGDSILGYLFGQKQFSNTYQVYNSQKDCYYYIPNSLKEVSIASGSLVITDYAFNNSHSITKINIPATVSYIGMYAFFSDTGQMALKDVIFNDFNTSQLDTIASYSFKDCKQITQLLLPNNLARINSYAFEGNIRLATLQLEDRFSGTFSNLKYIGNNAFAFCEQLNDLEVPSKVQYIGTRAFYDCIRLTQVDFALNGDLLEIGNAAFMNCTYLRSVETPSKLKRIGDRVFYGCTSLHDFRYGMSAESLEYIGYQAFDSAPFYGLLLTLEANQNAIIYFADVAYAYNGVFSTSTQVELRTTTISLSPYIFKGKNIFTIDVQMDEGAFAIVKLNSNLRIIGRGAFENCNFISTVTLPPSVMTIEADVFKNCISLSSMTIQNENNLQFIGQNAFSGTSWFNTQLEQLQDNSMLYIGRIAHKYKGTMPANTEFVLASQTVSISPYAFENQLGLVTISLPESISSIGQFAFGDHLQNKDNKNLQTIYIDQEIYNLTSLAGILTQATKVIINYSPIQLKGSCSYSYLIEEDGEFITVYDEMELIDLILLLKYEYSLPIIYVPQQYYNDYIVADGWCDLVEYIKPFYGIYDDYIIALSQEHDGVDIVYYIGDQQQLVLPDKLNNLNVVGIRGYAFNTNIQEIELNNKIMNIYDYAFCNSRALNKVVLSPTLKSIGNYAFKDCVSLVDIYIPNSVESIGKYAFYGCTVLEEIVLGNGIKRLDEYAFANCNSLKSLSIPSSINYIGERILDDCFSLLAIIMRGSLPPTLTMSGLFYHSPSAVIFIKDEAVEIYIDNQHWKKYRNRIQPMSQLLNYAQEKSFVVYDIANLLVDENEYSANENVQLNFTITNDMHIYIAPSGLTYSQLTSGYQKCNVGNTLIQMPSSSGEYILYVISGLEIMSIGNNIIKINN